jgi:hypothetical protein
MTAEVVKGASYVQLIASETESDAAFCTISGPLEDSLTGVDNDYPYLDFKLDVTAGTLSSGGLVELYRVPYDGSDQAPTPGGSYLEHKVGWFVMDGTTNEFFWDGVENIRKTDKFIWRNNGNTSVTATLYVIGRSAADV